MTNAQTISQLKTAADAAKNHIDVTAIKAAEAQSDYDEAVGGGDDDFLSDLEDAMSTATGLHKRAIKRHAALIGQLADAEALARVEDGNAAQAEADSLLAEVQGLLDESAIYASKMAEISAKAKPLLDKANEKRRWVVHCGVQMTRPTLKAPDFGPTLESARAIACLPGAVWINLYG